MPPRRKLRIIVGGLVGQFPLGGVAWDYFHYLLGLDALGHEVYYHEDTWVWPYDPTRRSPVDDAKYTSKFLRDFFKTYAPQLADRWHYVLLHEKHYGMTRDQFDRVARTADVFLNVSGACFFPDALNPKCVKVFLDTDPGYNQIMLSEKFPWAKNIDNWCGMVASHDRHFTYAENIYNRDCKVPRLNFDWITTRCVVNLPHWSALRAEPPPRAAPMSTVMTWDWFNGRVKYKGVEYRTKVIEYTKFHDLPRKTDVPLKLAVGGKVPYRRLKADHWKSVHANRVTLTPGAYQKFIQNSAGEWSVAKNIYVATRTGWFSCRSACYLAAGRPAVLQDTAWSKFIPSGRGVIAFKTMDEAIAGLEAVAADPAKHRAAAYDIAREYLAPDRVLAPMIDAIFKKR